MAKSNLAVVDSVAQPIKARKPHRNYEMDAFFIVSEFVTDREIARNLVAKLRAADLL